jgi:hypothetical protein
MTKQKAPRMEILRRVRMELRIFPRNDCVSPKALRKPAKRNATLIPNNKKFAQGTFRVAGNLAKTRK